MDTLLLIITTVAVATAIASLTSAARLRRSERERSEARVAALASAAEAPGDSIGHWKQVEGEWQWSAAAPETPRPQMMPSEPQISALFGTVQREAPSSSRLPILTAAILIGILGGALVFLNTSAANDHAASAANVVRSEPLELVALGHTRAVKLLTISGTVRNPMSGTKVERLTAVVSLLDREGALVSTRDVPLDYRALGPGEEAPFKLSVPDPGSVVRYRVSFRAGTDVVPHVDRRSSTKLASAVQ